MSATISILTGFLGSGKTTLLRHLLTHGMAGRRVAVIVNEIGAIGLDGRLIAGFGVERMVELSNGCICCTASSGFVLAVEELLAFAEPEAIIIETTGLADPGSIIRQVRAADYPLDSVVTVVDVANFVETLGYSQVVRRQIASADFLVLNKLDLASPTQLAEAREVLRTLNGRAALIETSYGALDGDLLFAPALRPGDSIMGEGGDHLRQEGFGSFALSGQIALDRTRLEAFISSLPPTIYRAKGFAHCADATWPTLFQYVAGRAEYEWTRFKQEPANVVEAVFIGKDIDTVRDEIAARLRACEAAPEDHARWLELRALRLA